MRVMRTLAMGALGWGAYKAWKNSQNSAPRVRSSAYKRPGMP